MKTQLVCTIGPATNNPVIIEKLANLGMKWARINCSHGGMVSPHNVALVEMLKKVRAEKNLDFKIALDTKGPDIRIGRFENGDASGSGFVDLDEGQEFTLVASRGLGNKEKAFCMVPGLAKKVKPGQRILLSDGMIKLVVKSVKGVDIKCVVELGGRLLDRKTLFVVGANLGLPFMADYDKQDLLLGKEYGMEVVFASFVNSEDDLVEMQKFMKENDCEMPIISKIESSGGIEEIDRIIELGDGIMVARGDLGVEYPVEQIPALQEMIVKKCKAAKKFVIVATEMMESMRKNPRPTRAEVTDVYLAVRQGADAVMTSAETATGKFPVETIEFMARIAKEAEKK